MVSKNLVKKSLGISLENIWSRKKVSVSVTKILVSKKSLSIGLDEIFWSRHSVRPSHKIDLRWINHRNIKFHDQTYYQIIVFLIYQKMALPSNPPTITSGKNPTSEDTTYLFAHLSLSASIAIENWLSRHGEVFLLLFLLLLCLLLLSCLLLQVLGKGLKKGCGSFS